MAASELLPLTLIENANVCFAAANNQAARQARGELLVFLNNDTVVRTGPYGLALLIQTLRRR